jgi:membrane peptidoglycan carboxypeptidase
LNLNGLETFINKAREFGITTFSDPRNYGLSLTLGGGEVRMVDMAVAFGTLANAGMRQSLQPILKIEDYHGKVIDEYIPTEPEGPQVVSSETAYLISHILLDNQARSSAFGPSSFLNVAGHPEVSVKTGTTNDKRDNWTIGYNSERLAAVWVGNNDNTPLGAVASGITGASPIWNRIIKEALKDKKPSWPIKPESIIGMTVCAVTGLLPPDPANPSSCYGGQFRFEYFKKSNSPKDSESLRRDIPIDKTNGSPATSKTSPENVEYQNHAVAFDIFGTMICLDCSFNASESAIMSPTPAKPSLPPTIAPTNP